MRAYSLIRAEPCYRREAFNAGLERAGFEVHGQPREAPRPGDVLVIWNRYARFHELANRFEHAGGRVIVCENGPLGRDWRGEHWYSVTGSMPGGAGIFPDAGAHRWESFGANLCEWRKPGKEIIVLAQRGIGPPGIAQPKGWHQRIADEFRKVYPGRVRIREHPGEKPCKPLDEDLLDAQFVVTWGSGAALKALLFGVPVLYGCAQWIGAKAASPLTHYSQAPDATLNRTPMFHRLAWSMYRIPEIATGRCFQHLLTLPFSTSKSTRAAL